MTERYHVGGYWSGRKESAEECARRAETFFRRLSRCDPLFSRWFEQADSLEEALRLQFEPTYQSFVRLFGKEDNQLDGDGIIFGAWTGHDEGHGSGVTLICGSNSPPPPNNCRLYLPDQQPNADRVLTVPLLEEVLRALVLAWEPDWATVFSDEFRATLSETGKWGTFVGWVTYVSRRRGEVPPLPEPVRVEPVEDKGTLIILTPERLTITNPEHVSLGQRIQQLLKERGLLRAVVEQRSSPIS
jgi:hypothetical protein